MVIFVFDRVENIVGKGENAGHWHFLLFSKCFQKASFPGSGFILGMKTMGPYGPLIVKKRGHFQILGARYF